MQAVQKDQISAIISEVGRAELVNQLFHLVHLQWMYRNKYLHFLAHDGAKTVTEYEARMRRIAEIFNNIGP